MKYRTLGGTDIAVSEVGFGVWTVSTGWWGEVDDERSVRLLREARERGINYFDTADTYGSGKGETLLADAFGHVRDEVVISTKIGYDFYNHTARRGQQERPQDWSESFVRFALGQSLKRLDTDYIDFLQLHNTKMDAVEDDGLFALMDEFRSEGKIRAYGIALGPKIGWLEEGVRAMRERGIEGVQMIYNLLDGHVPDRTRPPLLGDARRPLRREHDLRQERPPSPPPERVANHRPKKSRATLLPHRIRRAHPRPGRTQIRPRLPRSSLHPPEYLRPGADRGIRRNVGGS
jgi:aryl-alcohol dehydrogenase-like predicted oxidoreductase